MDALVSQLLAIAERNDLTEKALCERLSITPQNWINWKARGIPRSSRLDVCAIFKLDPRIAFPEHSHYFDGIKVLERSSDVAPDDQVFISRVEGVKLSAGSGEMVFDFEEVDRSHAFRRDYMQRRGLKPEQCKLYGVRGESMAPTINDGDIVMINTGAKIIVPGNIYCLAAEDGLRIKRLLRRADGSIEMRSDNPMQHIYPPEIITSEHVSILGKVVWHAGDL